MNERPCIRCQHPVLLEDGHLVYCSHCGAPQIFLSQELQDEIAQQTEDFNQRVNAQDTAPEPGTANPRRWRSSSSRPSWPRAIRYALLSAAVAFTIGLLSLLLPVAANLLFFWAVLAPTLTVGAFAARSAAGRTSSGFAARLGLLTGMLVGLASAFSAVIGLTLARFVRHDSVAIDAQVSLLFAQQRTMLLQKMGDAAQPTLNLLTSPEVRVGLLLCIFAIAAAFYLLLSTLTAGLAGVVLSRRRSA